MQLSTEISMTILKKEKDLSNVKQLTQELKVLE